MTNLAQQLSLWERAVEDAYFARRDRELIRALHDRAQARDHHRDGETGSGRQGALRGRPTASPCV